MKGRNRFGLFNLSLLTRLSWKTINCRKLGCPVQWFESCLAMPSFLGNVLCLFCSIFPLEILDPFLANVYLLYNLNCLHYLTVALSVFTTFCID